MIKREPQKNKKQKNPTHMNILYSDEFLIGYEKKIKTGWT